ncbi:MAG: hypothetical protein ABMA00_01305 [Gemmatimonas sp.]
MNGLNRAALLITAGLAGIAWTLALDTWKPGQVPIGWFLVVTIAALGLGILDLALAVGLGRVSGVRSPGLARLGVAAMSGATLVAIVAFGLLWRRGHTPNLIQFVQQRTGLPLGHAEVSRAADGVLELRTVHGVEISIERTKYDLDVLPSSAELHAAQELIDATTANAERLRDYEVARTSGGFTVSNSVLGDDVGSEFEHLINPDNLMDAKTLDPERPEALVFRHMTGDKMLLVGVMYMTKRGEHGPQVAGPLTKWHYHPETAFCMDSVGVPRTKRTGTKCAAGLNHGPSSEMMHVWLVDNTYGAFAHMMGGNSISSSLAPMGGMDHSRH